MKELKKDYSAPETDVIVIDLDDAFCVLAGSENNTGSGEDMTWGD